MQKSKCNKDLYKSFLQASSVRYSGKALSEVSPKNLSHDSASRWLNNSNFRPNEVYKESSKYIDHDAPCLLVGDDTVLSKQYSKKIDLVNYQYGPRGTNNGSVDDQYWRESGQKGPIWGL